MWSFRKNSIATQLSLWFLLVALLPLALVTYMTYRSSKKSLTKEVTNTLIASGRRQSNQIEKYLRERERSVTALSHSTAMSDAMEKLERAFNTTGPHSTAYAAVEQKFWPFAAHYQEASGYEDLYLISLNGDVVFSSRRRKDFGVNLRKGRYRESELRKVFERSLMSMATELSDFAYYEPAEKPVAFIAAPLFKSGFLVAIVAVQMNNQEIYSLVNDYTGLGETGEMVVAAKADGDAVFITPTRHDPDASFQRKVRIGGKLSIWIQEAVQGKKGSGITTDYRGREVLAIWRYLPYLRWGMAVKIDTEEAFAPIAHLRVLSSIIAIVTLLLVVSAAVLVARSFSNPIVKLTEMTKSIAGGDLTQRIDIPIKNEIGLLAGSFNEMTRQLKESIENLKETTAAKERIESELKIAHEIQMSMVPKIFPPFPDRSEFDIFATLVPAKEVGGDLYDFFFIDDDHLCFAVGDVSGKGVPASLFMAVTKTLFRATAGNGGTPGEILARLNTEICRDNESCMFVTFFCAILNIRTGHVDYSNGGHNLPYYLHRDGVSPLEKLGGIVLGLVEQTLYASGRMVLGPGEALLLYTDGVTEAMDPNDTQYSDQRLEQFLVRNRGSSPRQIIGDLVSDVRHFAGAAPQSDDITVLALRYFGKNANMVDTLEIKLKNKVSELDGVNQTLREFGQQHGLAPKVMHDLNLALEEILTNIISYGYKDERDHEIKVRLSVRPGEVKAEVEDDGQSFNPLAAPEPHTAKALEERTIGGLGIHLVRTLMDGLEYKRQADRNILTIRKKT
jgi:serine phosphatase RsbU (regulator of sigma subunit)/anti-sigma regulatory factor (Ser/Thr protein kinase)